MKNKKVYVNEIVDRQIWNTRPDGSLDVATYLPDLVSMTQQQFADSCDLSKVMERYERAGGSFNNLPNPSLGQYLDLTNSPSSYSDALDLVLKAQDGFLTLSPKIRSRFQNDPGELLQFLKDPKNLHEARELGLSPPENTNANDNSMTNATVNSDDNKPKTPASSPNTSSSGS